MQYLVLDRFDPFNPLPRSHVKLMSIYTPFLTNSFPIIIPLNLKFGGQVKISHSTNFC